MDAIGLPKPQSIRRSEESDPAVNPNSDSALKVWVANPTKSEYTGHEFDATTFKDAGLSNIPDNIYEEKESVWTMRQQEAIQWELLGYKGLANICNNETIFEAIIANSRNATLQKNILAPPYTATIKQHKKTEGEKGFIQRSMSGGQEKEVFE